MSRGFTIIELLVVVIIVGIFATLAAPSMGDLIASSAVRGASSDFYAALLAARSEAIKRRTDAVVAPSGSGWASGWTVKVGASTFQQVDALSPRVAIQVGAVTPITYGMNGRVSAGAQTLVFYNASNPAATQARCVGIDPNGLPRVRLDTNRNPADGCN